MAKTVGEKLKAERKARNETLEKVHIATGVPIYWLSRIENGKELPCNGRSLERLAAYYGLDGEALYKAAKKEKEKVTKSGL